jgi:LysR family transcriptional regulator, nod-box dependent transcriptional activator
VRFNNLDLNLLVALDTLLAEHSITRAARRLNLSQSATSGILARLREYFDDDLLQQVGRDMKLTALAAELAGPVRDVLTKIRDTVEMRADFDPARAKRRFRVIASDYSTTVLLADVVRRLAVIAPGVKLEILSPSTEALEQAEQGRADLVFIPDEYDHFENALSEELFTDSYCCVIWKQNSKVGDRISLEQYLSMGHVATQFDDRTFTPEELFCNRINVQRRIEVTSNMFSLLPHLVVGTDRIATVHLRAALQAAKYLPIRMIPTPMEIPNLVIMMKWHRYFESDLGHQWLRSELKQEVRPLPDSIAASGSAACMAKDKT